MKPTIEIDELRETLSYDKKSGLLRWKRRLSNEYAANED